MVTTQQIAVEDVDDDETYDDATIGDMRPHDGPQTMFLSNGADICIGGGSAGGGKTFSLIAEPARHIHIPRFNAVLFRRTYAQIEAAGGPWPESEAIYPALGGVPTGHSWYFPTVEGRAHSLIQFSHLQHEKNRLDWKGAQIALLLFDQLEDFTEQQFWYLLSRNRSTCGVRPYVRGTCNPVPAEDPIGGWLRKLLDWWINPDTGYAIPERSGVLRYFLRIGDTLTWADSRQELIETYGASVKRIERKIKSLSFVPMGLDDNPTMAAKDPDYEATLESLPYVDRMRLRHGNWNVRDTGKGFFQRTWFKVLGERPTDAGIRWLRFWDTAGTEKDEQRKSPSDPDATAGALVGITSDDPPRVIIADMRSGFWAPGDVESNIVQQARLDGYGVSIREEEEGGGSGKAVIASRAGKLLGFDYDGVRSSAAKATRWKPLVGAAEHGHVYIVRGPWNEQFLHQCETADGTDRTHDDEVDAAAGAFLRLAAGDGIASTGGAMRLNGW